MAHRKATAGQCAVHDTGLLSDAIIAAFDGLPEPARHAAWSAAEVEALRRWWPTKDARAMSALWPQLFGIERSVNALEKQWRRLKRDQPRA